MGERKRGREGGRKEGRKGGKEGGREEGRQTDGWMGRRMNGVVDPCLSHDRG